ncbi:helix-turn-helix domain-containing protein [Ruegeria aquimaris]|uniref:helix-turn-helix domain-containing protein n=1 Tax=Ruegeria aquimaris TaxID=2984333 RepID=UPI00384ED037
MRKRKRERKPGESGTRPEFNGTYLDAKETALILGLTRNRVYQLIQQGRIDAVSEEESPGKSRKILVHRASVDAMKEAVDSVPPKGTGNTSTSGVWLKFWAGRWPRRRPRPVPMSR